MKFDWKQIGVIVLAVLTFGVGWIANNQVTIIAFLAMAIVWLLSWAGKTWPQLSWIKGKAFLTGLVFLAAFGLSFFIQPFALPTFPSWTGDVATFVPLLAVFLTAFFTGIQAQVLFAIGVYNILLSQVLDKLSTGMTAAFLRLTPKVKG
jgi:hypothetical protein